MLPPIVLFDDPRLTTRSSFLAPDQPGDAAILRTVGQYAELMNEPVISAPIFGVSKRLIYLRHNGRPIPLLNPVLLEARDFEFRHEACWPNLQELQIRRERPKYVSIQAMAPDGSPQNAQVSGETAQWMHWHLELLNGASPTFKMTEFQLYLAYRLQYFQERGWPLQLSKHLLSLADRIAGSADDYLSFDEKFGLTFPGMIKLSTLPDKIEVDLLNPFRCLSPADQILLRILYAHHHNASFSVLQVANPMLVLAANLIMPKEKVISVADDGGRYAIQTLGEGQSDHNTPLVGSRLTELAYRDKPDAIFMDWCWEAGDEDELEADIRKISKKLTAKGTLYLSAPTHLGKLDLATTVFKKVFPTVFSISEKGADIISGLRSTNVADNTLQASTNAAPLPWSVH